MKRLLSILLAMVLMVTAVIPALSVAATGEEEPYEVKTLTTYVYSKDQATATDALFTKQLPTLPYLDAADFLDRIYTVDFTTTKNQDGTYSVTSQNGTMVVDTEKDTLYFDAFEHFIISDPVIEGSAMENTYAKTAPPVIEGETKSVTLDLGAYGIDLIAYQEKVYFPLPTLADLVCITYNAAEYIDGILYYVHTMDSDEGYIDRSSLSSILKRDPAAAAFSYRELCFFMDHFYGAPAQGKLAASITEKGFDKTLDEYSDGTRTAKELLQSPEMVYFYAGMMYLDEVMFDGGHTSMTAGVFMSMADQSSAIYNAFAQMGKEQPDYAWQMMSAMMAMQKRTNFEKVIAPLREEAYKNYETVKAWNKDASLLCSGDTVIFVFDSFKNEVIEPFKWSLDYAAENGIENFLIDLTYNGGGSSDVVAYIYTIIMNSANNAHTNQFYMRTLFTTTGNIMSEEVTLDLNLDGVFDEKDCDVAYDLNFAFLCTPLAFSCGNLLPCLARENGIPVLGDNSGGGSCALSKCYFEGWHWYTLSSPRKFIKFDGTDADYGSGADYELFTTDAEGNKDYSALYDIKDISNKIHAFYGDLTLGDADGDGSVTVLDATAIQRMLVSLEEPTFNIISADVDLDQTVTIFDATFIQRHLVGLSCPEGIGSSVDKNAG